MRVGDLNFESGVYVKKARKKIQARLSKATSRVSLYTKYGYDTKFASNLIQLLYEGIELMNTGWVEMPLKHRQDVLDVKAGKYSAEHIQEWADDLVKESEDAFEWSEVPTYPDIEKIERFAMAEVKKYLNP